MEQTEDQGTPIPSAFISYSWDNDDHREWVIALATKLREDGVAVTLDYWDLPLGGDKTLFMEEAVEKSDHVLLICTPNFKTKADGRLGGVGWEASIVTGELANDLTQTKFIPVLREGTFANTLPRWLTNRVGVDLRGDPYSKDEYQRLLRALHREVIVAPPVGPRPVFGQSNTVPLSPPENGIVTCDFSPRAQLLSKELLLRAFPLIDESSWAEEIELSVPAYTNEVDSIFSRLRGHKDRLAVAYGFDVAIVKVKSLTRIGAGGTSFWKAKFEPIELDFSNDMEVGTSSTTADQFAEKRVRRLLLNENPKTFKSTEDDYLGLANEAMNENLVQGLHSMVKIEHSGFINLFTVFGTDPRKFLEIAWISAITDLKLSASVQYIDHLTLALDGDVLAVDFAGRRHRKYVNVEPYRIEVKGTLKLKSPD